jgi:hypothetical protein
MSASGTVNTTRLIQSSQQCGDHEYCDNQRDQTAGSDLAARR